MDHAPRSSGITLVRGLRLRARRGCWLSTTRIAMSSSIRWNTGSDFPMSTMPGESVGHVFAGPMHDETVHWIEAVAFDRPEMCLRREG